MAPCPAENQNQGYGTSVTAGVQRPGEARAPARGLAAPPGRGGVEERRPRRTGRRGLEGSRSRAVGTLASPLPGLPNRAMSSLPGHSGVLLKLAPFSPSCRKLGKPRVPWWAAGGCQGLRGPPQGGLGAAPSGRRTGSHAVPQTDRQTCNSGPWHLPSPLPGTLLLHKATRLPLPFPWVLQRHLPGETRPASLPKSPPSPHFLTVPCSAYRLSTATKGLPTPHLFLVCSSSSPHAERAPGAGAHLLCALLHPWRAEHCVACGGLR